MLCFIPAPLTYVLHRVVEVRPKDYVILGDNCAAKEYGITEDRILGIMISYVRKGREHSINDRSYRLYSWYIMHTIPVRLFFKRINLRLRRFAKKLIYGK